MFYGALLLSFDVTESQLLPQYFYVRCHYPGWWVADLLPKNKFSNRQYLVDDAATLACTSDGSNGEVSC